MIHHYEDDNKVFLNNYEGQCVELEGTYFYYVGMEDGLYKYEDC